MPDLDPWPYTDLFGILLLVLCAWVIWNTYHNGPPWGS